MDISRLLIANRGEIAVRIARTAHRLGMSTVGVYSEPDANALHVDSVDVAVALGGATPAESYLRGDAIIAAIHRTGIGRFSGILKTVATVYDKTRCLYFEFGWVFFHWSFL